MYEILKNQEISQREASVGFKKKKLEERIVATCVPTGIVDTCVKIFMKFSGGADGVYTKFSLQTCSSFL